jgi:8-oxo-dGTP pyrophosphatase MutT (NUDIX family)
LKTNKQQEQQGWMEMTDVAQAATEEKKEEKEADHHPYYRPKDAATLILVDRSAATPKVLVGKRHDKVVFMPGKFVFPGGRVDKSDNRVPVAAPIPQQLEANLLKGSPKIAPSRARALAVAAIREACEETGLCLGRQTDGKAPKFDGPWRPFADAGLLPDPSSLFLIARAITPPGRIKRFDTRFFTADASAIAHRVDGVIHADAELVELVWVELGSQPLADLHPMTKNVLGELEKRLATGPLRHDAPVPFFHFYDGKMQKDVLGA